MDMTFKGAAKPIDDIDLPRIGATIGVGEDELHAFMDVEAAGSPFDSQGRPKMLFEPHVFYRLLGKGAKRDLAVKDGLAYAKWGAKPYPRDSYPRLIKAMAIDAEKALQAASWGLSQILAQWHRDIGYPNARAMVEAFMADAEAHLAATVKLLSAWKTDAHLRAHRWEKVAEDWNGPAWRKNDYAGKMRRAFAKWQKIKDTPYTPEKPSPKPAPKPAPAPAELKTYTDRTTIEVVQRKLKDLGYTEVGGIDGTLGKLTRAAILAFRDDNDLPLTPTIDDALLAALDDAKTRQLAPKREEAAPADVREKVPEVRAHWLSKVGAWVVGIPAAAGALFDGLLGNLGSARGYVEPLQEAFGDVPGWVWLGGVAVIAGGLYLIASHGERKGVEAFQSGARR